MFPLYCVQCHKESPPDARVCVHCGLKFGKPPEADTTEKPIEISAPMMVPFLPNVFPSYAGAIESHLIPQTHPIYGTCPVCNSHNIDEIDQSGGRYIKTPGKTAAVALVLGVILYFRHFTESYLSSLPRTSP